MPGSRWYPAITAAFATSLVVSNIIAVKLIIFGPFTLPAAPFWTANTYDTVEEAQRAVDAILGFAPRLLAASFLAYLARKFLNSYVLARMKIWTEGKLLLNSLNYVEKLYV